MLLKPLDKKKGHNMAITLTELIENPEKLEGLVPAHERCVYCGVLLQETITGNRKAPSGRACSDCFFEHVGEGVESNPVVSGKIRRG
jgi:hypothetical protein